MPSIPVISSHWYYHFENLQLSSNEFYAAVDKMVKDRNLPNVSVSRLSLSEGGLLSPNREYLRVKRYEYVFDICAAPFGKQFFTSWWLGETSGFLSDLLSYIPFIGSYLARRSKRKTYYQIDTETMFKESIHAIIISILNEAAEQKGLRALSESEQMIPSTVPVF